MPQALDDLNEIDTYRCIHHSKTTANRVLTAIKKAAYLLEANPQLGKPSPFTTGLRHQLVQHYPYTIVYRLTGYTVQVLHNLASTSNSITGAVKFKGAQS